MKSLFLAFWVFMHHPDPSPLLNPSPLKLCDFRGRIFWQESILPFIHHHEKNTFYVLLGLLTFLVIKKITRNQTAAFSVGIFFYSLGLSFFIYS